MPPKIKGDVSPIPTSLKNIAFSLCYYGLIVNILSMCTYTTISMISPSICLPNFDPSLEYISEVRCDCSTREMTSLIEFSYKKCCFPDCRPPKQKTPFWLKNDLGKSNSSLTVGMEHQMQIGRVYFVKNQTMARSIRSSLGLTFI